MAKYRNDLPQLSNEIFLTDGGLETTLIFHEGLDLPEFAAFHLLKDKEISRYLRKYFRDYARFAFEIGVGFILESPTWRANPDWGKKLGYSPVDLAQANRKAIELLRYIRAEFENEKTKMVISGCLGPRGDGYVPGSLMTAAEAEAYHSAQINVFSKTEADLVTAMTLNYVEEAIGIARAARRVRMPAVISFTVETDGRLPNGKTLKEAIEIVDEVTDEYPAYYMINCAHPTHFEGSLEAGARWTRRIRGIRANSSAKSHAELNDSIELDQGNPAELGRQYRRLLGKLKSVNVLGGCCGTDLRHVREIARLCANSVLQPEERREFEKV